SRQGPRDIEPIYVHSHHTFTNWVSGVDGTIERVVHRIDGILETQWSCRARQSVDLDELLTFASRIAFQNKICQFAFRIGVNIDVELKGDGLLSQHVVSVVERNSARR